MGVEVDRENDGLARGLIAGHALASTITVPFCQESQLSGLGLGNSEKIKHVWYRRHFSLPGAMAGKRLRLHFGAVDYQAWVYLNGEYVGTHAGESASFSFEVTSLVRKESNELVVHVLDDMTRGLQPKGKQAMDQSEGCVYTRTTGIWQTVWLEAVGSTFVESFSLVTDIDQGRVLIGLKINGSERNLTVKAEAFDRGARVASETTHATGSENATLVLMIPNPRIWQPGGAHLYDLKVTLSNGKGEIDVVEGYFGLRKITLEGRRVLINNVPIFQRLVLDQGFYPDGVWTAPTDEDLVRDIQFSMAAGYNGARLHQKVFEPRFLYHADRMGYLVWGEFPNWGLSYEPESYVDLAEQWTSILQRDRNHPSLIGWCPFNETKPNSGELQALIWKITRVVDPTRPVLETSGWHHFSNEPEILDAHDYDQNPETFRQRWDDFFKSEAGLNLPARYGYCATATRDKGVPFFVSEFGGIGWAAEGGGGYGACPKTLEEFYARYQGLIDAQLDNPNFFGFCYTQLTDVEQEKNGLFYYDRKPKFDLARLHAITSRAAAYERNVNDAPAPAVARRPQWRVLVGGAADLESIARYRYRTTEPIGDWKAASYDDSTWAEGFPPFGQGDSKPRTLWKEDRIYLRYVFQYVPGEVGLSTTAVAMAFDESASLYLNGELFLEVRDAKGWGMYDVTAELKKFLVPGLNYLAIEARQSARSHPFDLALLVD